MPSKPIRWLWTYLALLAALPFIAHAADSSSLTPSSPVLAGPVGEHCAEGSRHTGQPVGTNVTIAGVPTYVSRPHNALHDKTKVLLFFSDIYSSFYINNQLLQDYFSSEGFHVLGLDYFFGDPIQAHDGEPGFDRAAWVAKSKAQADASVPRWVEAVRETYGPDAKYNAVGYCFGAPYSVDLAATDKIAAGAFAHPSGLTEDHFNKLTKPLLLSCAETDSAFPTASRNRATDILTAKRATYHVQVFSGVTHGFATRGNLTLEHELWAKEESARSVVGWFNRFSK